MKIALINADFPPSRGSGQTVYAEKIARGLAKNHHVTVITSHVPGSANEEWIDNARVIRLQIPNWDSSKWLLFGRYAAQFLHRHRADFNFDIIHFLDAHVGYAFNDAFIGTLHQSFRQRLNSNKGFPYSSSIINLVQRYPYYLFSRYLERKALKKATAFISVSKAIRKEFINHYEVEPFGIRCIHNGIDTDLFQPTTFNYLTKKFKLENVKIILYIGFSTPRKGLETLAHAVSQLKERNIKLIIVGKWEKGYRKKFYSCLGDSRDKIIEAGYVPDIEIPAYYSLADVFVLPSLLEGFGFPLVESMACETPVISTNVGAIPEIVDRYGIIIPPHNSSLLAEKIDFLISNDQIRYYLGRRSRTWVLNNFSENIMIDKTISYYQELIDDKKLI
ncbi:putative Glycosyl transferase, group 1 [Desulfosarcina cetonica]|uniref:glycosyltransferase family 4 protein n=1 Tax=Desulfosarcina cetonica TaxID=90730 RepID=UPI0009FADFB9|nr:glycosyltransferase family 4 protein [Desulfosarcina cetonica]VTR64726.1 putative Glycosyl transferase, group 1 [Desulfosarcina cetonica]